MGALVVFLALSQQSPADDKNFENLTAEQAWDRVVNANRLWLLPKADNRSFVVNSVAVKSDVDVRDKVDRVWVSGRMARWEMGTRKSAEDDFKMSVVLVVRGEQEEYLKGARPNHFRRQASHGIARFVQGITWRSSLHIIAQDGLPEKSRIVNQRNVPGGRVLVLETDLGPKGGSYMGLGLNHEYLQYGHAGARFEKVRIHIKTPEFIPIKEEYLESEVKIEFSSDFFVIGDQLAPKTVRYLSKLQDGSDWIIEANFQRIGDNWVLKNAKNIQNGTPNTEMAVSEFSADPVAPSHFAFTEP
jgi:hypothetical protein